MLTLAARLERGAANAYLGVIPSFADPVLAQVAGRLASDETMHWTVLAQALSHAADQRLSFGAKHIQDSLCRVWPLPAGLSQNLIERFWRHGHGARLRGKACHNLAAQRNAAQGAPCMYITVLVAALFLSTQHQAWSMPQGTPHAVSNSMKAAVWPVIL